MLTPRIIETFCRWWSRQVRREITSAHLFAHAFQWKYRELRDKEVMYAYVAFTRSGYIPDYVREYWRVQVRKYIVIEGGQK